MRKAGLLVTNCVAVMWAMCGGALEAAAQQSAPITTTTDFRKGNNEGLISTAQDRLTRNRLSAGTVGAWSATTALPAGRLWHSSVVYNGFVYAIGGQGRPFVNITNDVALNEVQVAILNADGSVGAWTSTAALPTVRTQHSSVVYNGFLYVIGGQNANGPLSDVLVAPINADGSLGTWASTTALPSARYIHTSVVHNGYVYAIGGREGNNPAPNVSTVLVAPLNADGSVGTWSTTTALPSIRSQHSSVAYNGFIYVIGGSEANTTESFQSSVQFAPINADGTIGDWSTASTTLPTARHRHSSVVYNGFVYAIGGNAAIGSQSATLVAPINADGSVGDWSATTDLPSTRMLQSSVVYEGNIYTIGGSGPLSEVVVAPIDTINNNQTRTVLRGFYSHLVDMQSEITTVIIRLNGQTSPGGSVRLQVRLAPDSTGVFGTETVVDPAPLGSDIEVVGTGRYVWIRLMLDDTATSNEDQPTFISDITVNPISPPTAGVVNDGLGADIDTQTSATTIEANWSGFTFSVGDSIAFYEWAIGTAPGLTNVQNWTSVGSATSATNSTLNLSVGVKYVSVRATGTAGLTSAVATSNGVQVQALPSPPSGGDDDEKKGRCGLGSGATAGTLLALLGGIALLASAPWRRRRLG